MITWFLLSAQCLASYPGNTAVAANALEFKTLADAMRIRNHVIDVFERADSEPDPECCHALLNVCGCRRRLFRGGTCRWVKRFRTRYHRRLSKSLYFSLQTDLRIVLVHS
jgi:hypothetical protein